MGNQCQNRNWQKQLGILCFYSVRIGTYFLHNAPINVKGGTPMICAFYGGIS